MAAAEIRLRQPFSVRGQPFFAEGRANSRLQVKNVKKWKNSLLFSRRHVMLKTDQKGMRPI